MMTKTKLKKIIECGAEEWEASISSSTLIFKALDDENIPTFKVIVDDDPDISYVIFYDDDKVDILFPDNEKNKALLDDFLKFVYDLVDDFEEVEVEDVDEIE